MTCSDVSGKEGAPLHRWLRWSEDWGRQPLAVLLAVAAADHDERASTEGDGRTRTDDHRRGAVATGVGQRSVGVGVPDRLHGLVALRSLVAGDHHVVVRGGGRRGARRGAAGARRRRRLLRAVTGAGERLVVVAGELDLPGLALLQRLDEVELARLDDRLLVVASNELAVDVQLGGHLDRLVAEVVQGDPDALLLAVVADRTRDALFRGLRRGGLVALADVHGELTLAEGAGDRHLDVAVVVARDGDLGGLGLSGLDDDGLAVDGEAGTLLAGGEGDEHLVVLALHFRRSDEGALTRAFEVTDDDRLVAELGHDVQLVALTVVEREVLGRVGVGANLDQLLVALAVDVALQQDVDVSLDLVGEHHLDATLAALGGGGENVLAGLVGGAALVAARFRLRRRRLVGGEGHGRGTSGDEEGGGSCCQDTACAHAQSSLLDSDTDNSLPFR